MSSNFCTSLNNRLKSCYSICDSAVNDLKIFKELDKDISDLFFSFLKEKSINLEYDVPLITLKQEKNGKYRFYLSNSNGTGFAYVISEANKNLAEKILSKMPDRRITLMRHSQLSEIREQVIEKIESEMSNDYYLFSSGGGGHKFVKDGLLDAKIKSLQKSLIKELELPNDLINIKGVEDKAVIDINEEKLEKVIETFDGRYPPLHDFNAFKSWLSERGYIHEHDTLHDFLGIIGKKATGAWDNAQTEGKVSELEKLAGKQWLSDILFGPFIFFQTLMYLMKYRPKNVISTQAMAIPAILRAVSFYNGYLAEKNKLAMLQLYMTDMPTGLSQHFFNPTKKIGQMNPQHLQFFHLFAPKPVGNNDIAELSGLPADKITLLEMEKLPIRPSLVKAAKKFRDNPTPNIQVKVQSEEEYGLLKQTLNYQGSSLKLSRSQEGVIDYPIGENDRPVFLMLGTKPTEKAVLDYVNRYVQKAQKNKNKNYHLFAYTGNFKEGESSFYKKVVEYISTMPSFPSNLSVIPLSYQTDEQLVSLMLNANTITRFGGGTVMVLLVLNAICKDRIYKRKNHAHAEEVPSQKDLIEGIYLWERGNFKDFKQRYPSVKVITPKAMKKKERAKGPHIFAELFPYLEAIKRGERIGMRF